MSITKAFMTSISTIVMECYVKQTDDLKIILQQNVAIFENSLSRVIPLAVVKINKMAKSRSHLEVNEVCFC